VSDPLVSVIIPALDAAAFLPAALDSVFAQTTGALEVVVVDDGSADDSVAVAKAYGRGVRVIEQARSGSASARNRGIEATSGELIAFLDADDLWLPDKTRLQLDLFERRPDLGMVFSDGIAFDESGDRAGTYFDEKEFGGLCRASSIFLHDMIMTPTVILRRACLRTTGLFDEGLKIGQDTDLFFRLALRHPFDVVNRPLIKRRLHGGNITRNHRLVARCATEIWGRHLPACAEAEPEMRKQMEAWYTRIRWNHHFQEGCALLHEGRAGEARRHLGQAVRLDPFQPRPWVFYATSWLPRRGLVRNAG